VSYRFEGDESVRDGFRRCAREQLDSAIEALTNGIKVDRTRSIHEARKSLKKERSLLRMGRGALDRDERRRDNAEFRDAARRLGEARDADVMVQALDDLAERFSGRVPEHTFELVQQRLAAEGEAANDQLTASSATGDVVAALTSARLRIDDWHLSRGGWAAVSDGLRHSYAQGQRAFVRARSQPSAQKLHEWRKRAKDLWYELRLLAPAAPDTLRGHAAEAHRLADLLGDDHDLSVLRESLSQIAGEIPDDLDPVFWLLDRRRGQLQTEAFFLGERIYAETPQAFQRRMHRYWKAWRSEAKANSAHASAKLARTNRSAALA
jgi:CHAD domain-containing protein